MTSLRSKPSHVMLRANEKRPHSLLCRIRKYAAVGWSGVLLLVRCRSLVRRRKETPLLQKVLKPPMFTFSYTKYTKIKYCNRQKIRTRDFDESPRFRPP
ncbi:hypothetical protein AVEN_32892-1 [Araneus ventricosus]|uniref:Uncharacterized protein n=1 Tax=Araneus ventricosus TaxID=182803 RepID=A0A4Y2C3G1_ARAVE|nr:hypothetical protein AVEN_32892-1 [Araneus ventricosus]